MPRRPLAVVSALLWLCQTGLAAAQVAGPFELSDRNRSSIGIITIELTDPTAPPGESQHSFERATGVIISGSGFVLSAAHVLSDEAFDICTGSRRAPKPLTCDMNFYWKGDERNRYALTIAGERSRDRDFVVFRLPNAIDKIGQAEWPFSMLSRTARDGEMLHVAGYAGSLALLAGSPNPLGLVDGRLGSDEVPACSGEGWGGARRIEATTSPGWSGGPVFNGVNRLAGIVLGRACDATAAASPQDAATSRVLLVENMTGLCTSTPSRCFFGFPGDIDPPPSRGARPWQERLVGGSALAEDFVYGLRLSDVAKWSNYLQVCYAIGSDAKLGDAIQADAARGAQLALVYRAVWAGCRPGASIGEQQSITAEVFALADRGYEPAEFIAAFQLLQQLMPKIASRQSPADELDLSAAERAQVERAGVYLNGAAERGWVAARYGRFELCRQRVLRCSTKDMTNDLRASAAEGQIDATRSLALALLIGDAAADRGRERFNFGLPQNTARALALLRENAIPRPGAGTNSSLKAWDNTSAAFLSYLYGGGRYRGAQLVARDAKLAFDYEQGCYGGPPMLANPLHAYCAFNAGVLRFNDPNQRTLQADSWRMLVGLAVFPVPVAPLARNLASWSPDGSGIERISCDLDDTFSTAPPAARPRFEPGVAYCYFSKLTERK